MIKVIYFVADSGRRPVEEFVDDLNIHSQRKFEKGVGLLESLERAANAPR